MPIDLIEWGEIQGRPITFPMDVPDANIATVLYAVAAQAASSLLPGEAFEVVETNPGVTQLIIAACDYRENPWGDYNEINLGLLAKPTGAGVGAIGSFVYRMPVNQSFTCEAGNRVMGFPKTVQEIDVEYAAGEVTFALTFDGVSAFRLRVPRVRGFTEPARMTAVSYSYLDGAPFATNLEMDMGTVVENVSQVQLDLGAGVVADELRSLGLPKSPDLASWGEGLGAIFHMGREIAAAS